MPLTCKWQLVVAYLLFLFGKYFEKWGYSPQSQMLKAMVRAPNVARKYTSVRAKVPDESIYNAVVLVWRGVQCVTCERSTRSSVNRPPADRHRWWIMGSVLSDCLILVVSHLDRRPSPAAQRLSVPLTCRLPSSTDDHREIGTAPGNRCKRRSASGRHWASLTFTHVFLLYLGVSEIHNRCVALYIQFTAKFYRANLRRAADADGTRPSVQTVTDVCSKRTCSLDTSAFSALDVLVDNRAL